MTIYPVKIKEATEVNPLMQRYVQWAERQVSRKVKTIVSDNGLGFSNEEMQRWYQEKGIVHCPIPPNSSRLNLCERTQQSIVGMSKAMMLESGFPKSLWVDALSTAMSLKNRTYSTVSKKTPYEGMFNNRPDVHHVRKFGAKAYIHVPVSASRRKFDHNANIGYVLGYHEKTAGYKVYVPESRTTRFVADARVDESVMFKDRYAMQLELSSDDCSDESSDTSDS